MLGARGLGWGGVGCFDVGGGELRELWGSFPSTTNPLNSNSPATISATARLDLFFFRSPVTIEQALELRESD